MSVFLSPGSRFGGRYEVVRRLSHGGMGAVYEVLHRETARRRALKVMLPTLLGDHDMHARFLQEARVTAEIESENLVETFDAGIDPETEQPFLVMELLKGEDLEQRLFSSGPLGWEEVVRLLSQAARGLDKTHAAGIVHRDLKPENLFVTKREDGSPLVKILDFGIAKVLTESGQKRSTRTLGTPLYMAPEMLRRNAGISAAVDRYALGHIAYTLMVGTPYFQEDAAGVESALALLPIVDAGAVEKPSARAKRAGLDLGAEFDRWFAKATAHAPEGRFATCSQQITELEQALQATPPQRLPSLRRPVVSNTDTGAPTLETANSDGFSAVAAESSILDQESSLVIEPAAPSPEARVGRGNTRDFTVEIDSAPRQRSTRLLLWGVVAVGSAAAGWWAITSRSPGPSASSTTASAATPSSEVVIARSSTDQGTPPRIAPNPSAQESASAPRVASAVVSSTTPPRPARSVVTSARRPAPLPIDCVQDPSRCR